MKKSLAACTLGLAIAACSGGTSTDDAANVDATSPTRLNVERVSLPGEGRGDYINIDAEGRRMYVTHTERVHILDLDTLEPLAEVTGLTGKAHGVAIDRESGHGFATDGVPVNQVVMFDLATGKVLKKIKSGAKPDSILFDPASKKIFAFNNESSDVSVIDPVSGNVVKTIKLPAGPEFSQTDGKGNIWVNLEPENAIAKIDAKKLEFTGLIKLDGCEEPAPLGFDAANRRLFAGCAGNSVMKVVDAEKETVLASLPIGGDPDGIAYDPKTKRIYVANRDGAWTIIDQKNADEYAVNQTLPIDEYAKTVAVDPKTGRAFSSSADLVWPEAVPGKKHLPDAKSGTFRLIVVSEG